MLTITMVIITLIMIIVYLLFIIRIDKNIISENVINKKSLKQDIEGLVKEKKELIDICSQYEVLIKTYTERVDKANILLKSIIEQAENL